MWNRVRVPLFVMMLSITVMVGVILSVPFLFALHIQREPSSQAFEQFPVTVDPENKTVVENVQVNAFLDSTHFSRQAAVGNAGDMFWKVFAIIATTITDAPWYQSIAAADGRFVTITAGMRKEQVASTFAKELQWTTKQQREFTTAVAPAPLPLIEGSFSPGTYLVTIGMTPSEAQALVNERFTEDILSHYGPETEKIVPLEEALIIASLIQRETIGTSDMRLVSGVIWNRIFIDMKLQIDATLQYAKANVTTAGSWWPKVVPADIYRRSAHNTYLHAGLPPTPIASPSVAAVLAALNPIKTSCLFYFNDKAGNILCTDTYAEHVALLKKHYGRGK